MAFNVRSGGKAEGVQVVQAVKSGNLVRVGSLVGIAEYDAKQSPAAEGGDNNYYTTLALEGIAHATITGAVTVGQALYTTTAHTAGNAGVVATLTTSSAAGARPVGIATRAKGTGEGEVWFKLVPSVLGATA